MVKICAGLFLIALTTLMVELTLIRVFDVIWYANMAYMVITLAMFCFGLSGVFSSLWPIHSTDKFHFYVSVISLLFAIFVISILPILNGFPFITVLYTKPEVGIFAFIALCIVLGLPFFMAGLIFTNVFTTFSKNIQSLYFYDLLGAAIGCVILVPFLPKIGPGGVLFAASAFGLWASGLFSNNNKWMCISFILGVLIILVPFTRTTGYYDFKEHLLKRGVHDARIAGKIESSYWDPISKIDVIDQKNRKHLAYDGGTQSTFVFEFNGDLKALRKKIPPTPANQFTGQNILMSHYLKRDTDQSVLIIGAAGGQETKAALMYGAKKIDAVELVGHVIELGKKTLADYNGNIFNHSAVNAFVGEGRSYLRGSLDKYDIIQIFSNHTSSSIAGGGGAMSTNYLQTVEAYQEYFNHLKEDGILQINHHIYPRMITTAALAWKKMGRNDFKRHVIVCLAKKPIMDNLPTVLFKMTPWSADEVETVKDFLIYNQKVLMVENPLDDSASFLSSDFYSGSFPNKLARRIPYRVTPATDNKPYFNFIRKKITYVKDSPTDFLEYSTAALLNMQIKYNFIQSVPRDILPLFAIGFASIFFTAFFIFVPLYFSKAGKIKWSGKKRALCYFACLGSGFIIFELLFIQIFMKLIGFPLYTYSTVVFTILFAAGIGSTTSEKLAINIENRWEWPFIGIIMTGIVLIVSHNLAFDYFLTSPLYIRIAVSILMIFPLGYFLGMPFPMGILAIRSQPDGAIAWAWGINGLFTIIGGLLSIVLSIYLGFKITLGLVVIIYAVAFYVFGSMRRALFIQRT